MCHDLLHFCIYAYSIQAKGLSGPLSIKAQVLVDSLQDKVRYYGIPQLRMHVLFEYANISIFVCHRLIAS